MRTVVSAFVLACAWILAAPASADPGFINSGVNVRAGPGVDFPRLTTLSRGMQVDVRGCIESRQWCDVIFRGGRGWVSARYLDINLAGRRGGLWENRARVRLPILSWNIDAYWNEHYRGREFNRQRDTYRRRGPQQQSPTEASRRPGEPQGPQPPQSQHCDDGREAGPEGCAPPPRRP